MMNKTYDHLDNGNINVVQKLDGGKQHQNLIH